MESKEINIFLNIIRSYTPTPTYLPFNFVKRLICTTGKEKPICTYIYNKLT